MACRINRDTFRRLVDQENDSIGLRLSIVYTRDSDPDTDPRAFNMASVERDIAAGDSALRAVLNRKPIQSLVDEPEQARVIIRNLLRWAKEHGAQ